MLPEPSLRSGSRLHIEPMLDASSSRPIFCEGAPPRSSPCPDHDPALHGAAAEPSRCWATAASAERLVARRRARPNLAGCREVTSPLFSVLQLERNLVLPGAYPRKEWAFSFRRRSKGGRTVILVRKAYVEPQIGAADFPSRHSPVTPGSAGHFCAI